MKTIHWCGSFVTIKFLEIKIINFQGLSTLGTQAMLKQMMYNYYINDELIKCIYSLVFQLLLLYIMIDVLLQSNKLFIVIGILFCFL